eukprot:scaffold388556_cov109-Cyclotella_meneghiniana.AAC.1
MQVLDEKERAKQQVFEAEMKVSLEKQRSKLNMQEERRKNAAYLASVKDRLTKQLAQQKSDAQAIAELSEKQHQKKIDRYKAELQKVRSQLDSVEMQWADKLSKLDAELSSANDLVLSHKSKYRNLMQRQIDEAKE